MPRLERDRWFTGRSGGPPAAEARKQFAYLIDYFGLPLGRAPLLPREGGADDAIRRALAAASTYLKACATGAAQEQAYDALLVALGAYPSAAHDAGRRFIEQMEARERAREAARRASLRDRSKVYFIGSGEDGPIKIGMAIDPAKRLAGLQTSHPHALSILALVPGGQKRERRYHERFAAHRLNGEWFARHPDILAEIDRLSSPIKGAEG